MKQTISNRLEAGKRPKRKLPLNLALCLFGMAISTLAGAQTVTTTTVQGTVYLASGAVASGTLVLSWPSFTTAAGQSVTADSTTVTIASGGLVSVNLAPNLGATPAGLYYTAVYYLSDGTTTTQYWVVPAATSATIAQVQAQLMPAAQAVQTVSKSYVDEQISELSGTQLSPSGGTLTGPLYLSGDPTQPLQAADKHYVDINFAQALPLSGGAATGPLTALQLGAAYQADQFPGTNFGAKLQACINALNTSYGGTCDARNFTAGQSITSTVTVATSNAVVYLPCAAITTANQIIVPAGTRNVSLRGCALQGGSPTSGSQGGTAFLYSGAAAMIQVGDPTYAVDTPGFHIDNAVINTTASTSATAQALVAYRTQEMNIEELYLLGNANQTGITLDGTGNYTGGSFLGIHFSGFQTALNAIGHQVTNPATTDWLNASTFVRLHIDCPTSSGSPIAGTYGINLQQGDGNTFTGGDVEGCNTALHLGANAQNNTIVGLRNENSNNQVVTDSGSAYNNWITGGTMFTGKLTDNGERNSFLDTFHRSFNGLSGDWYGSQQDATVTNHYRLGIGLGNERGLLNEIQTDYGYRWIDGYSDAAAGEQFYQIDDLLNSVNRLSIGQYNQGVSNTNNQTVINAAGTGAVVLNGSNNSGTGGVVFGSGGATETTVATISNAGNAQFNGNLLVGGTTQSTGTATVRNNADAEVDYYLWPGLTASQKGSYTYKDWNGNSQWYMVKDASNNWALNSAIGGLDSFKAYQSTNSGDTYVDASNNTGFVRINYESGSGTGFNIYGGSSSSLYASFTGTTTIKFPGLAASAGYNCLQVDSSGYLTNTGSACATGSGSPAAPTSLTWSQGNTLPNSAASANGIAAWVNVAAGTPGTWAAVPLGNSLGQIAPSQISATTGSGNVVLAGGPTFTGNITTFANAAAAEQDVTIQPGTGADQVGAFAFNSYSGASEWKLRKDASNYLRLTDVVNSFDRAVFYQNGQSILNAGAGSNPVVINGTTGSGTSGLLVESGGSSPSAVLTVSGSGNTTAAGFVSAKFMLGSSTMSLAANSAAGSSPTIACAASHVCDGVSGTVTLTTGTGPTTGTLATLSFPNTHSNDANCVVAPTLSGAGLVTSITWSESTTALTLTANTALTAGTAYQVRYWCGGN